MIERISNGMMIVKPTVRTDQQAKQVGIKVESKSAKPADYLYNPNLADKISTSRESIKEEMNLLRDASLKAKAAGKRSEPDGEKAESSDRTSQTQPLDVLKRSLVRMKSLLYQVASVAGADPDSLQALQRKLAEELRGYDKVFKSVELKEIVPPDLKLEEINIGEKMDPTSLDSDSIAAAREAVSSAEDSVDRLLDLHSDKNEEQSHAEAVLATTDQNMAAAESALYPEKIMSRAKKASLSLQDSMPEVFGAQAHLQPDQVYKLLSND